MVELAEQRARDEARAAQAARTEEARLAQAAAAQLATTPGVQRVTNNEGGQPFAMRVWIDPDNFNIWLKPKIGQCQADGQFKIVKADDEHVAPDPFSIA